MELPQAVRAALIELYETELDLEPGDMVAIDIAAAMLARAAQLDAAVKREGQMIPGGNRAGMMVLHPGFAQAQTNRASARPATSPSSAARATARSAATTPATPSAPAGTTESEKGAAVARRKTRATAPSDESLRIARTIAYYEARRGS
ncbi:hypothetical protein [Kitasatospora sp. NPDC059673]|uniref:hypothetical protein n=1 Tax=Kitasatospora sp. NPDC059673 TaxID=3346901 RepID=UPI0036B161EF